MSRTCDAIACKQPVASGRFMCLMHWRMVPLATQRTINTRYRAGRTDFAFLSDLVYLKAAVDAIDGIATQEKVGGTNPYRRLYLVAQRRQAPARDKKPYIIRVWAGGLESYLGYASEDDVTDADEIPRTSDYDQAWKSEDFVEARRELRRLVEKHPTLSFKLDVGVASL